MDNDLILLHMFDRELFDDALEFIKQNNAAIPGSVNPSINDDYGLRSAICNKKYDIAKELVSLGCKLSSVHCAAVRVYLKETKYKERDYEIFSFIFNNINPEDWENSQLTYRDIFRYGITKDEMDLLIELKFVTIDNLWQYSNDFYSNWDLELEPVFDLFIAFGIRIPIPNDNILECTSRNLKIFDYYYKEYKERVIQYYNTSGYTNEKLLRHIIDNNITDIHHPQTIFKLLLSKCDYMNSGKDNIKYLDYIEKCLIANIDNISRLDDSNIGSFCPWEPEGPIEINEINIAAFKLVLKYNLINLRAENDRFYHHVHLCGNKEAIEFIDQYYTLTVKEL